MLRAALYLRASTQEQGKKYGLDAQETDCRAHCAAKGYTIVLVEKELHTGTELDERRGMTFLRQQFRRKAFDVLVVGRLDRLTRNFSHGHMAVIRYEAEKYDIRIESATQGETEGGTVLEMAARQISDVFGEIEHGYIIERTTAGMVERVKSGAPTGRGRPPYGYLWADAARKRYVIDPATAPIVQSIFAQVAAEVSLRLIARQLTNEAIPTSHGATGWDQRSVAHIVRNPLYWGQPKAMRWTTKKTKVTDPFTGLTKTRKTVIEAPRSVQVALPAEVVTPLVSADLAAAAHAAIARRITSPEGRNPAPERYLLRSGFARCGLCGAPMTAYMRPGNRPTYRCSKPRGVGHILYSVAAGKVDAFAWEKVETLLQAPELLTVVYQQMKETNPDLPTWRVEALEAQLGDIAIQQATILDAQSLVSLAANILAEKLDALVALRESIERELHEARQVEYNWKAMDAEVEHFIRTSREFQRKNLTYADRRLAMRLWGVQVLVYPKTHVPRWDLTVQPFGAKSVPVEKNSTIIFPLGPLFEAARAGMSGLSLRPTEDGRGWMLANEPGTPGAPTQPLQKKDAS